MKVMLLSQYFWPENFPINNFAASLAKYGVELEVVTGKPNYPEGKIFAGYRAAGVQRDVWNGMPIIRMPLVPRGSKGALGLALNYLSFVAAGLLLAPWHMRGKKVDAILVYAPSPLLQAIPALLLGRIKKAPVAIWVQDLWPDSLAATGYVKNSYVLRCMEAVVRFIYRRADLLLVQSRAFEAPVARLAGTTRVAYFPNPVDRVFSVPFEIPAPDVPALDGGFTVVFAGNVGAAQGVNIIVEAATRLQAYSEIRFVVIGSGSRWEWMRDEIARRGLHNLHLVGRFPLETMPALMQKASVLLVCLADRDIFTVTVPSKVQAYLGSGRPIIASLNGEGARIVREARAGIAVPAEDADALTAAVLELYRMPDVQRAAMGQNGRRYCKDNFDHGMLASRLVDYLQSAMEHGKDRM